MNIPLFVQELGQLSVGDKVVDVSGTEAGCADIKAGQALVSDKAEITLSCDAIVKYPEFIHDQFYWVQPRTRNLAYAIITVLLAHHTPEVAVIVKVK